MEQFMNKIINADCLDILKQWPDKCIDLVLTDPPYGIGCDGGSYGFGMCRRSYAKKKLGQGYSGKRSF